MQEHTRSILGYTPASDVSLSDVSFSTHKSISWTSAYVAALKEVRISNPGCQAEHFQILGWQN